MALATMEIYRTESGAVYEVAGDMIRRSSTDGRDLVGDWQRYRSITRVPASLLAPGDEGEILEVVLEGGRRIFTSRLLTPFG